MKTEPDEDVTFRDITLDYACLALWGPKARMFFRRRRRMMSRMRRSLFDSEDSSRSMESAVWAQRVSYVGELGWELYIPNHRALMVWDILFEAGREFEYGSWRV